MLAAQSPGLTLTSLLMHLCYPSINPRGLKELQGPDWSQLTFSPCLQSICLVLGPVSSSQFTEICCSFIHPHKLTSSPVNRHTVCFQIIHYLI